MQRFNILFAAAIVLSSCGEVSQDKSMGSEGDACYKNGTCDPGLTCLSNTCVRQPDWGSPDQAVLDMQIADGPVPDIPVPDLVAPDGPAPDMVATDLAEPEMIVADQTVVDLDLPDQALPDQLVPDLEIPDLLIPDLLVPDQAIPDLPMPDLPLPLDFPPPDVLQPDQFVCTGCEISGTCYQKGALSPGNSCRICDPPKSTSKWTLKTGCVSTVAGICTSSGYVNGASLKAKFRSMGGIAVGTGDRVYISDQGNHCIRLLYGGVVSTVAGTCEKSGFTDGSLTLASFKSPRGIAVDGALNLYVADAGNHAVRNIVNGKVGTLAGTGTAGYSTGYAPNSHLNSPSGVAQISNGVVVYVTDTGNKKIRQIKNSVIQLLGGGGSPWGLDMLGNGKLYYTDTATNPGIRYLGGGYSYFVAGGNSAGYKNGSDMQAQFRNPQGVAPAGSVVYVADTGNQVIRKVASKQVTLLAGTPGTAGYKDGSATVARFSSPVGVAIGSDGLYVADSGNYCVRFISY